MKHTMHLIGNAHLDPVWLWRWQEGFAEVKATFRSALDRMNEFPEFIFTCAGAAYYKWVEENAPEMFEEIRRRIAEGRWVIVGGWWIQPDCNIPSGESFARHGLYSQRYYLEKFGTMAKVGYNVDSFGHHGMLPQILKKSGLDYYVFMRPGSHEKELPGNLFWWESEDGSRVMTFKIPYSYANYFGKAEPTEPREVQKLRAELKLAEEQGMDFMFFYGVGNHGGGPTIANLNLLRKLQEEWDFVTLRHSSPNAFFNEMDAKQPGLPVVKDDLQHHASGCYSAHSETKMNNRKAEHRLLTAEKWAAAANRLTGLEYPGVMLQKAWENVLFNQFHDILGGCSIKEAYQDAREACGESLHAGAQIINSAVQKLSWSIHTARNRYGLSKEKDWMLWEEQDEGAPLVVFNPLSWAVRTPVQINKAVAGITDETGSPVALQRVRGPQTNGKDKWNTLFVADLPAMGYRTYWIYRDRKFDAGQPQGNFAAQETALENDWIRLELEPHTGYIKNIFDKRNHVNVLAGCGAVPVVVDDYENDTWAHGKFAFRNEIGKFSDAEVKLLEEGPLRSRLRVTSRYNQSVLVQDFILCRDRCDIGVEVKLDWREKHKILKLSFPVNVDTPKAAYEIPYGYIERPVNGEEEPGQQWLDVSGNLPGRENETYGLALLNDAKYSFDVKDGDLRMTAVRSAMYADHFGERDEWCECMDQGLHAFKYTLVPHTGEWKDAGIVKKAYELNVQPVQVMETYHRGELPQKFEGLGISAPNIIAAVFKKAEDGVGYVLRCYETSGAETDTDIEMPLLGRKWRARFGRCEIKTFYIPEAAQESVEERNLLEL